MAPPTSLSWFIVYFTQTKIYKCLLSSVVLCYKKYFYKQTLLNFHLKSCFIKQFLIIFSFNVSVKSCIWCSGNRKAISHKNLNDVVSAQYGGDKKRNKQKTKKQIQRSFSSLGSRGCWFKGPHQILSVSWIFHHLSHFNIHQIDSFVPRILWSLYCYCKW